MPIYRFEDAPISPENRQAKLEDLKAHNEQPSDWVLRTDKHGGNPEWVQHGALASAGMSAASNILPTLAALPLAARAGLWAGRVHPLLGLGAGLGTAVLAGAGTAVGQEAALNYFLPGASEELQIARMTSPRASTAGALSTAFLTGAPGKEAIKQLAEKGWAKAIGQTAIQSTAMGGLEAGQQKAFERREKLDWPRIFASMGVGAIPLKGYKWSEELATGKYVPPDMQPLSSKQVEGFRERFQKGEPIVEIYRDITDQPGHRAARLKRPTDEQMNEYVQWVLSSHEKPGGKIVVAPGDVQPTATKSTLGPKEQTLEDFKTLIGNFKNTEQTLLAGGNLKPEEMGRLKMQMLIQRDSMMHMADALGIKFDPKGFDADQLLKQAGISAAPSATPSPAAVPPILSATPAAAAPSPPVGSPPVIPSQPAAIPPTALPGAAAKTAEDVIKVMPEFDKMRDVWLGLPANSPEREAAEKALFNRIDELGIPIKAAYERFAALRAPDAGPAEAAAAKIAPIIEEMKKVVKKSPSKPKPPQKSKITIEIPKTEAPPQTTAMPTELL